jgi:hypothetical protein
LETNSNFIFGLAVLFGRWVVILATGGRTGSGGGGDGGGPVGGLEHELSPGPELSVSGWLEMAGRPNDHGSIALSAR